MIKSLLKQDIILTIVTFILIAIGIVTVYSTTQYSSGIRELIFAIAGIGIYFFIMNLDYRIYKLRLFQVLIFAGILFLLIAVFLLSKKLNNTHRWFALGGIDIQPAEFAKIVVILLSSSFFSIFLKTENFLKKVGVGLAMILPIILLVYKQPALGTSIILFFIFFMILFASYYDQHKFLLATITFIFSTLLTTSFLGSNLFGANINFIIININIAILGILIVGLYILYKLIRNKMHTTTFLVIIGIGLLFGSSFKLVIWDHMLKSYQKNRIIGFLNNSNSNLSNSTNFQTTQSKIAIGSGGFWGKGYGEGTQSRLDFLPESTTDFIYATFTEEFGFLGNMVLLLLYIIFLSRIILIMSETKNRYAFLIIVGIISMILIQLLINVGMNLGIMPVTGIPLPLISYGGSSLITTLIAIGIAQNIHINRDLN